MEILKKRKFIFLLYYLYTELFQKIFFLLKTTMYSQHVIVYILKKSELVRIYTYRG